MLNLKSKLRLLPLCCLFTTANLFGKAPEKPVIATYFAEWGVYGRDFPVAKIPGEDLTHILYAFIAICGPNETLQKENPNGYSALVSECRDQEDYTVTVHDRWAALDKTYPGDKWDDVIKGNFGELVRLKSKYPHLRILPSIGGWTLSDPFYKMASTASLRKRFVDSAISFLKTYTMFDGIDIDWEYPQGGGANLELGSDNDGKKYALLMKDLRLALDKLEAETGRTYELSSAVGTDPKKIKAVDYQAAAPYLDYVFAMSYDFYGAWNSTLGHHAALYPSDASAIEGFSGADAVTNLLNAGVPKEKLVLGYAMYGRGWKGVQGSTLEHPFAGVGQGALAGTWEAGVFDYKDIATRYYDELTNLGKDGYTYGYDQVAEAPYLIDAKGGRLITFENARSIAAKVEYVRKMGLAGLFSWEIDADNGNLLKAANEIREHESLNP